MLTFKAKLISRTNITLCENNKPYPVEFIEFKTDSPKDLKTISKVNDKWRKKHADCFVDAIYSEFKAISRHELPGQQSKFYGLIKKQDKLYNSIQPQNVFGLMQITKSTASNDTIYVDYLQTSPNFKHGTWDSKYKNIGKAMLSSLKKLFGNCDIVLDSVYDAIDFYKKNGFKISENGRKNLQLLVENAQNNVDTYVNMILKRK